ncbi:hypothetical protein N7517_008423 [Penicillium concentricum]|uniref:Major facilitator superfamily (MFS) profile domain-containing protein n=1 Tax=Penicillium concentricum TaxID=293559 RepID=A0A9W9RSP0_9EURO|nr:uncharacterized protein N7517_008423 [Penicillium concentricum]KAJ5365537.1 hypothetical protein N7517_008423 [Penicillium concentricum]
MRQAFLIEGYQAGILGGVQDTKQYRDALGNPEGTEIIPMIASSYTLAATVMSIVVVVVGMPLGRRNSILLGAVLIFFGGIIQAASYSVAQIIVARVICGFGIALITCNVPMYMSEMSIHANERGPEVAINCSSLLAGVALSYWVDFGFTRMSNQLSWRLPIAIQSIFAFLSASGMFFCPDTPRWYYAKGRNAEGDITLARLYNVYRTDPSIQPESAAMELVKAEIMQSIQVEAEQENRLSWLSLVWDNTPLRVGRRIRISFIILSIQQMMGINIMVYYMPLIFSKVGLSSFVSSLISAAALTVQFTGSLFTIPTIERIGRRRIMLVSAAIQTCCMFAFVVLNGLPSKTAKTQWAAAAMMFPYLFMYGWGWVTCPWLYGPEIAPLKYRHIGAAVGLFGEWLFSFVTVIAGGIGLETSGWKIWIWPLVFNVLGFVFVYFMCPDPTGRTLEEIDALFIKDIHLADRLSDEKLSMHQIEHTA